MKKTPLLNISAYKKKMLASDKTSAKIMEIDLLIRVVYQRVRFIHLTDRLIYIPNH